MWHNTSWRNRSSQTTIRSTRASTMWFGAQSIAGRFSQARLPSVSKSSCNNSPPSPSRKCWKSRSCPTIFLLVEVPPHYGIAKFVRMCKGRSSRVLREEFPALKTRLPTLWTHSTFISTVGGAPLSLVKQYIQNQQRSEPRPKKNA